MKFELSEPVVDLIRTLLRDSIQGFWDDPGGLSKEEVIEEVDAFKQACSEMGLNFESVLISETTDYERNRIQNIIEG